MRKIYVLTFMSLDGIMQAPGGPEEDESNEFAYGGWTVPFFDDFLGEVMDKQMSIPFDLLLGRKTFEIFASYWPQHESPINDATKYVVSTTLSAHTWHKSVFINENVVDTIRKIKAESGPDLQVHGSSTLIQTLLANDLVDEMWLKTFPITLGKGKRLFGEGTIPAEFALNECQVSPSGVLAAIYKRTGDVRTGSFD